MFEIFLLTTLAFNNSRKARNKGLNPLAWGLITVAAYLAALIIGGMFVIYNFCQDAINYNQLSSPDASVRALASQQVVKALSGNFLHMLTIELFGIGGFLLIRYILDKRPDKTNPDIQWMDESE